MRPARSPRRGEAQGVCPARSIGALLADSIPRIEKEQRGSSDRDPSSSAGSSPCGGSGISTSGPTARRNSRHPTDRCTGCRQALRPDQRCGSRPAAGRVGHTPRRGHLACRGGRPPSHTAGIRRAESRSGTAHARHPTRTAANECGEALSSAGSGGAIFWPPPELCLVESLPIPHQRRRPVPATPGLKS